MNHVDILLICLMTLALGVFMTILSFVPYPRVKFRRVTRKVFRVGGIILTLLALMAILA